MARKHNPIIPLTGDDRLDKALASWRNLIKVVNTLTANEIELMVSVERARRGGVRESIMKVMSTRYGQLQRKQLMRAA